MLLFYPEEGRGVGFSKAAYLLKYGGNRWSDRTNTGFPFAEHRFRKKTTERVVSMPRTWFQVQTLPLCLKEH